MNAGKEKEPVDPWPMVLEEAFRVAAVAHRDQRRKASNLPYFTHPAATMVILQRSGFDDPEMLAAAALHDVVEDTEVTLETLAQRFPSRTVEFVRMLSERKHDDAGRKRPWRDRKEEHLARIHEAGAEVRAIFLADKLHNLRTMLADWEPSDRFWGEFSASPEQACWYYRESVAAAAEGCDDPRVTKLAQLVHDSLRELEAALRL